MRKLIFAVAVIVMAMAFGCRKESSETEAAQATDTLPLLTNGVGEIHLPMAFGIDGAVDTLSVSEADSVLRMTVMLDDDLIDSAALAVERSAELFLLGMIVDNDTLASVLHLASRVPVRLDVTVRGREYAPRVEFTIPKSEMSAIVLVSPELRERDELKVRNRVRYDNTSCPFEIEDGITLESMTVQDRYVTFRTSVDVDKLDFMLMKENRDSLNVGVVESLRAQLADSAQRQSLLDISDARLGYRNRYVASDRRDSFDISFTPADLARLIAVTDSLAQVTRDKKRK